MNKLRTIWDSEFINAKDHGEIKHFQEHPLQHFTLKITKKLKICEAQASFTGSYEIMKYHSFQNKQKNARGKHLWTSLGVIYVTNYVNYPSKSFIKLILKRRKKHQAKFFVRNTKPSFL